MPYSVLMHYTYMTWIIVEGDSLGGRKGGEFYAEKLSPEERAVIAKKATKARWSKVQDKVRA